jgi:flagellar hook-basal body complex protein FliE
MKHEKRILISLGIMAACLAFLVVTGCTVPEARVVTLPDGTTVTNVVHAVDPRLTTGLAIGSAANAASAPSNPTSPLIEIGLGAIAAGAAWVAKRKNDKAAANEQLLKVVIQAIDALDNDETKTAIQTHASRVGVEGELHDVVKKVGSGTI